MEGCMLEYDNLTTKSNVDVVDQGLRTWMLGIYNHMTLGLATTGATAWLASNSFPHLIKSPLWIVFLLLPFAFTLVLSFGMNKIPTSTARVLFYLFAVSMGCSMAAIFLVYTAASIASVFFITAATFGAASIYGYTTGRDLTNLGAFLFMGLIGIVIAGLVNLFLQSNMITMIVSMLGVIIFTCLTAYDTQSLKQEYYSQGQLYGFDSADKSAIFGALSLYLNFINLFMSLLNLLGIRKD